MATKNSKSKGASKKAGASKGGAVKGAASKKGPQGGASAPNTMVGAGIESTGGSAPANGLQSFAFHTQEEPAVANSLVALAEESAGAADMSGLDAETAARIYLNNALASEDMPSFSAAEVSGQKSEFKSLGARSLLTGTQTVKFRQHYRKIPVYGSLVTVELDKQNNFVSISSGLGDPSNVDPVARLSPAQALEVVSARAGYSARSPMPDATPRLYYYHDSKRLRWRLVYIVESVEKIESRPPAAGGPTGAAEGAEVHLQDGMPMIYDFVVDAHTGELVDELPRTYNVQGTFADGLGRNRVIEFEQVPNQGGRLRDAVNGIHTHDFRFRNLDFNFTLLPGGFVTTPPLPEAVSAHANAAEVALFLRNVLQRNGLDDLGTPIVSTVNCVRANGTQEWRNAAWLGGRRQMVYGQRMVNGSLRSYAVSLDVVAHEVLHGLTDSTARLEYRFISGALNESYSDIFGVIVSNLSEPDISRWNWELGEDLSATGVPIRDMRDPERFDQPAHMDDYRNMLEDDDYGGVHVNSGIHNKAAFNILNSKNSAGNFLFDAVTVAQIFYITLTERLAATSGFSDSRRGVELTARTRFATDPQRQQKLNAIARAFDDVGIS